MRNTVFPRILKIGAESLKIRSEEDISTFVIRKEDLLHDVQEQGIELQDQDFIWSLLYGVAPDQRLRLFLEPYYTFKMEGFKAELNRWTLARPPLRRDEDVQD